MGNPRPRPRLLSAKLFAIREFLNVDQADMASALQSQLLSHSGRESQIHPARISEYENGEREPNLFVLIAYSRLGQVHMEFLVDDDTTGARFRTLLGNQFCFLTFSDRPQREQRNNSVSLITGNSLSTSMQSSIESTPPSALKVKKTPKKRLESLGGFVRRTRQEKRLSVMAVSKQSALFGPPISGCYISRIELDPKVKVTADRLKALAHGLGIPVQELFEHALGEMSREQADELALLTRFRELSPKAKSYVWAVLDLCHSREF